MDLAVLVEGTVDYPVLIAFVLASLALALSPGPDNIFVLTQSISLGSRAGLAVSLGLVVGCLVHTGLVAFGVSQVIARSDTLFFAIKLLGAFYLLYLAYQVYRGGDSILFEGKGAVPRPAIRLFLRGLIMNLLNPKVAIFFLAFFPGFLFSGELDPMIQFFVLGLLFMGSALIVFGSIALLAGPISKYLHRNPKAGLYLKWLQLVVFVGIALHLLM